MVKISGWSFFWITNFESTTVSEYENSEIAKQASLEYLKDYNIYTVFDVVQSPPLCLIPL